MPDPDHRALDVQSESLVLVPALPLLAVSFGPRCLTTEGLRLFVRNMGVADCLGVRVRTGGDAGCQNTDREALVSVKWCCGCYYYFEKSNHGPPKISQRSCLRGGDRRKPNRPCYGQNGSAIDTSISWCFCLRFGLMRFYFKNKNCETPCFHSFCSSWVPFLGCPPALPLLLSQPRLAAPRSRCPVLY